MPEFSSHGRLNYPGRGQHFDTILASEFKGLDGFWRRVEIWRHAGRVHASTYRRNRMDWEPYGDQTTAMVKRELLENLPCHGVTL